MSDTVQYGKYMNQTSIITWNVTLIANLEHSVIMQYYYIEDIKHSFKQLAIDKAWITSNATHWKMEYPDFPYGS